MTRQTHPTASAPINDEPLPSTAVTPKKSPPDTEQTDASQSPPPQLARTVIERPQPADRATVIEKPSDQACKATELLPDAWEATAFLVLCPGERHERRVEVETPVTYIGRVPGNQVLLDDSALSRHHARIVKEGAVYVLIDQTSTNGTFVYDGRGQQWVRIARHELMHGTEIRIGRTPMRFVLERG